MSGLGRNAGGGRGGDVSDGWGDTIRWPLWLALACMAAVIVADGLWLASEVRPDVAAIMNGAAAVVTAIACIIEARRGNAAVDRLADHEARLRVLEDRGARS